MSKKLNNRLWVGLVLLGNWLPSQSVFAESPVTAIAFDLGTGNMQQFALDISAPELREHIAANLAEWGYPVQKTAAQFSHRLVTELGIISHQSTPVGLSFSSGNSDPRSPDFQKADVLPISCRLYPAGSDQVLAERTITYSVHALGPEQGAAKLTAKLADQISGTCLDVLESQKLAVTKPLSETGTFQPKWLPDVRVEVKQVQSQIPAAAQVAPLTSEASAAAAKPENSNDQSEKEIIIYNQGSPLILKFGHERR